MTGPSPRRSAFFRPAGVAVLLVVLAAFLFFLRPKSDSAPASPVVRSDVAPDSSPAANQTPPSSVATPSVATSAAASVMPAVAPSAAASGAKSAARVEETGADADFTALENEVRKALPTSAEIHRLTEEQVHITPEAIRRGGRELGRLVEAMTENPKLIPQGTEFFKACALQGDYPNTIRALCLAKARDGLKKMGRDLSAFPESSEIPEDVRRLSDKI